MNETEKISPEDPRLTAYALGELDGPERTAFEQLLQGDAAARASVEEIRATVAALGEAFAEEEASTPTLAQAMTPESTAPRLAAKNSHGADEPRAVDRGGTLLTFPRFYYMAAGLAAACFALVYVAHERDREDQFAHKAESTEVQHRVADGAVARALPGPASAGVDESRAAARDADDATMFALVPARAQTPDRFFAASEALTSTFPLRLSRDSYVRVREQLRRGERPAREVVHVAELINAFEYAWPEAAPGEAFTTLLEETAAPWSLEHRLVRVGLKGVGSGEVARAARVRVEFNPATVRAWRLIGFERDGRTLGVTGGDYGEVMRGGDAVTALYEVVLANDALADADRTLLRLALEYVDPASGAARTVARQLEARGGAFEQASRDLKFVAAVAAFGLAMRESPQQAPTDLAEISRWAEAGAGSDPQRREFLDLMQRTGAWLQ